MSLFLFGSVFVIIVPFLLIAIYDLTSLLPTRYKYTAMVICRVIPGACPFSRHISLGVMEIDIPPLCKFNPWYEQCFRARFEALSFLEDNKQKFNLQIEQFY